MSAPPDHPAGRVCIIVLNWNNAADTIACIGSLHRLNHGCREIVVCDNQSRPDDVARLRDWCASQPGFQELAPGQPAPADHGSPGPRLTLLHTGGNLGFAGGVNVGLRHALSQADMSHAWVLNNDTEVHPAALDALLDRVALDAQIGLCGSTLIYLGQRERVQALGGAAYSPWRARSRAIGAFSASNAVPSSPESVEAQMDYVVGAAMLVSRRFMEVVGLMDERYFLYSEEHDWAHRGQQRGFKLGWAPGALVFHKHGATIGTHAGGGSELSLYYLYRNKALFTARHYLHLLPLALPSLAWEGLKLLLKGNPSKALAIFNGLAAFLAGRTGPSY